MSVLQVALPFVQVHLPCHCHLPCVVFSAVLWVWVSTLNHAPAIFSALDDWGFAGGEVVSGGDRWELISI